MCWRTCAFFQIKFVNIPQNLHKFFPFRVQSVIQDACLKMIWEVSEFICLIIMPIGIPKPENQGLWSDYCVPIDIHKLRYFISLTACPTVNVPFYEDSVTCSVLDHECLGVECCVKMDFTISQLWLKTSIIMDPCNYQFSIGFENWSDNFTLFTYTWRSWKYQNIGNYLSLG